MDGEISVGDAGVVYENVEAFESPAHGAEQGVDRLRVANVTRLGENLNCFRSEFPADAA